MNKINLLLSIILFLIACTNNNNETKKNDYYKFKKQLSPSEKYIIYEYARYGTMAFSSDIGATEIFLSDSKFEEGKGEKIEGTISHWINNDTLLMYDFRSELTQPLDTLPIKTTYKEVGDFVIKTINYKTNSGGSNRYTFDTVWTNDDRIYVKFNYSEKKKNVRSFPLGSASIKINNDSIVSIEILGEVTGSMNFVYKNTDGTVLKNLPRISTTYYLYEPTKRISPIKLNKTKIFREE